MTKPDIQQLAMTSRQLPLIVLLQHAESVITIEPAPTSGPFQNQASTIPPAWPSDASPSPWLTGARTLLLLASFLSPLASACAVKLTDDNARARSLHSRYSIFIGLVVVAIMCAASWFFAPKGENQVSVQEASTTQQQSTHSLPPSPTLFSVFRSLLSHPLCNISYACVLSTASYRLPPTHFPRRITRPHVSQADRTALILTLCCSLWRSSLILAISSCYLMWAITFLAQLHPLIQPKRSDLREEFLGH